jgi:hypothetical protein
MEAGRAGSKIRTYIITMDPIILHDRFAQMDNRMKKMYPVNGPVLLEPRAAELAHAKDIEDMRLWATAKPAVSAEHRREKRRPGSRGADNKNGCLGSVFAHVMNCLIRLIDVQFAPLLVKRVATERSS